MKTKNRILTATNYTYLEPQNATRTKQKAKEWGSSSNYLNFLVAKDHKDAKSMARSVALQKEFFTPTLARSKKDRKGEYVPVAKRKAAKKKAAGKKAKRAGGKSGLVKAKNKTSRPSKKKSSFSKSKRKPSQMKKPSTKASSTTAEAVA